MCVGGSSRARGSHLKDFHEPPIGRGQIETRNRTTSVLFVISQWTQLRLVISGRWNANQTLREKKTSAAKFLPGEASIGNSSSTSNALLAGTHFYHGLLSLSLALTTNWEFLIRPRLLRHKPNRSRLLALSLSFSVSHRLSRVSASTLIWTTLLIAIPIFGSHSGGKKEAHFEKTYGIITDCLLHLSINCIRKVD
jgi:hypothetical protein